MTIGIVGLGLIGGSLAKAYQRVGATVYGYDQNASVTEFAKMAGAIDGQLDEEHFSQCDLILIAIPPLEAEECLHQSSTAKALGVAISAGSYKDFTRVAMLEPHMWTELFIENKDYLLEEIYGLIHELQKYAAAMENDNADGLNQLLKEGRERKLEVDYPCN